MKKQKDVCQLSEVWELLYEGGGFFGWNDQKSVLFDEPLSTF